MFHSLFLHHIIMYVLGKSQYKVRKEETQLNIIILQEKKNTRGTYRDIIYIIWGSMTV